ncbi:hypothetical protein [Pelistega indica]|uniref:hypothetical protein n=1 Tax=Pelistega indica TaxID=1414851 RepID=UPI0011C7F6F8|nr:hypothetical protein [Pelistega indica]
MITYFTTPSYAAEYLEPGYTDYDKHKAVITCMQQIYVKNYQEMPTDEDFFPLCEQRFNVLSRSLTHDEFIHAKAESLNDKITENSTGNLYYDALFGYPNAELDKKMNEKN